MKKKLVSLMLAMSLIASQFTLIANAETTEVTEAGGTAEAVVAITLDTSTPEPTATPDQGGEATPTPDVTPTPTPDADIFSATVPQVMPVAISQNSDEVTVADNLRIINNVVDKGIKITDIDVNTADNWSITEFNTDFSEIEVNTPILGMSLRGDTVNTDGTVNMTEGNWMVAKNTDINVGLVLKLPKMTELPENSDKAAVVGFTLDWSGDDSSTENPKYPGEEDEETVEQIYNITFITDGNGKLLDSNEEEQDTIVLQTDEYGSLVYPAVKANSGYTFDGWYNNETDEEITDLLASFNSNCTVKAVFEAEQVEESPAEWFNFSNGEITGLSTEYYNQAVTPTELVIPSTINEVEVTTIGSKAFQNSVVTDIVIPDTVTELDSYAFANSSLENITLSNNLASIGSYAFQGTDIESIELPETLETLNNSAFENCTELKSIDLSYEKLSMGSGGGQFNGCTSLKTVVMPELMTGLGNAKDFPGSMFKGCTSLTEIDIPNGVNGLTTSSFTGCTNLETINLSDGCYNLRLDNLSVQCPNLTRINISDTHNKLTETANGLIWRDSTICIGSQPTVKDLVVPAYASDVELVFNHYTSVQFPNSVTKLNSSELSGYYDLETVVLGNATTIIDSNAFNECPKLVNIEIPNTVEEIGNSAFCKCTSLESITIPSSVTTIGTNVFYGCSSLSSLELNGGIIDVPNGVFEGCKILTSVTLPEGVETIGSKAFSGCTGLTTVSLPSTLTSIGSYAFSGCSNLVSMTLPDSLSTVGSYALMDTALTSIDIPSAMTTIGNCAFYKVPKLTSVDIPDTVTSIGTSAFAYCDELASVTIGDGMGTIGASAFNGCEKLTTIDLGNSVQTIGKEAFDEVNFTTLTIPASVTSLDADAIYTLQPNAVVTVLSTDAVFGKEALWGSKMTIKGYTGSTAQTYASSNSFTFEAIEV